jgi:hypothetical protein
VTTDLLLPCVHNGRRMMKTFEEAHHLLHECSIGYLALSHWLRFEYGGYKGQHYLKKLVGKASMDWGIALLSRGRLALTLSDMRRRHPEDASMDVRTFHSRASRLAKGFPGVPIGQRPYRFLEVYDLENGRYHTQPAYQMCEDCTWILVFRPEDPSLEVDWELLQTPPVATAAAVNGQSLANDRSAA